jgi:hypothetical protein
MLTAYHAPDDIQHSKNRSRSTAILGSTPLWRPRLDTLLRSCEFDDRLIPDSPWVAGDTDIDFERPQLAGQHPTTGAIFVWSATSMPGAQSDSLQTVAPG